MKGNSISTFPPCYSFHIGEVIQIWLARLMGWDLGSSRKHSLTQWTCPTLAQQTQSLCLYNSILINFIFPLIICVTKRNYDFFFSNLRFTVIDFRSDLMSCCMPHVNPHTKKNYMSCLRDFYNVEIGCPTIKRLISPSTQN